MNYDNLDLTIFSRILMRIGYVAINLMSVKQLGIVFGFLLNGINLAHVIFEVIYYYYSARMITC